MHMCETPSEAHYMSSPNGPSKPSPSPIYHGFHKIYTDPNELNSWIHRKNSFYHFEQLNSRARN